MISAVRLTGVSLEEVRAAFREVNGQHPMTAEDDAYVRAHYRPATTHEIAMMAGGDAPLPGYLMSDGTPMVSQDALAPMQHPGGRTELHDAFVASWPDDEQDAAEAEWDHYLSGQYVCLREIGPDQIRAKGVWTRRMNDAEAQLAATPDDPTARHQLAEAMDHLEDQMLPQTGYDDLRFGGGEGTWARLHRLRRQRGIPRGSSSDA